MTDEERVAWLTLGRVILKLPSALDADMERRAGLSFFEYLVMAMLSEQPARTLRMSDLAARVSASLSRLSHVVSRLEAQGYVTKERCAGPGRSTAATLTDAGNAKVAAAAPGHVATARAYVIDALTARQLQSLTSIGNRILQRLEPDGSVEQPR